MHATDHKTPQTRHDRHNGVPLAVSERSHAGLNGREPVAESAQQALRFDWTDWLPYLEGEDVPEEQKRELIDTLWSIVVSFVDLGWRVDATRETGNALDLHAILTAANTEEEAG